MSPITWLIAVAVATVAVSAAADVENYAAGGTGNKTGTGSVLTELHKLIVKPITGIIQQISNDSAAQANLNSIGQLTPRRIPQALLPNRARLRASATPVGSLRKEVPPKEEQLHNADNDDDYKDEAALTGRSKQPDDVEDVDGGEDIDEYYNDEYYIDEYDNDEGKEKLPEMYDAFDLVDDEPLAVYFRDTALDGAVNDEVAETAEDAAPLKVEQRVRSRRR